MPRVGRWWIQDSTLERGKAAWVFVGQNARVDSGAADGTPSALCGRPEHTDSIQMGTWHIQLAGTKIWRLRPSTTEPWPATSEGAEAAAAMAAADGGADGRVEVACGPGDVLLINTRLWRHATELPDTRAAAGKLSVSVASEFRYGQVRPEYRQFIFHLYRCHLYDLFPSRASVCSEQQTPGVVGA